MREGMICLVSLILGTFACQQVAEVPSEKVDIKAEEAAIKAVLTEQAQAWSNRNLEGEVAAWAHEPYIFRGFPRDHVMGWDSMEDMYRESFSEGTWDPYSVEHSDYVIHISGDFAWAVYHQTWGVANDEGEEGSTEGWELRILEKKEDAWKIVLQLSGPYPEGLG